MEHNELKLEDMITEYIDLALPSGTKWASDYLRDKEGNILYLPYKEAAKLNIPTKEQFLELVSNCKLIQDNSIVYNEYRFLGTNGNYVHYHVDYYVEAGKKKQALFAQTWIKDYKDNYLDYPVANFLKEYFFAHEYEGLKFPIILVENK